MSTLNVDKVDPNTGTDLELGTSGDTVTVPSGVTLTLTDSTLSLPTTITSTTEVKTNKVSPATGTAFALGDSGDTFTVPSGATIVNSGTATGFGITSSSFLPISQPLFINGNMDISQRSTSVTGITDNGVTTVDRMYNAVSGIGTYQVQQQALTSGNAFDDGFATAYRIDCTTADASPAAADYLYMQYNFEGQDLQVFKKGTSNAETFTIAFWVKCSKTGVGSMQLKDKDNSNRQCTQTYTISVADTWEKKICAFGADTTGAFDNDNAKSLNVNWWLGSGTDYSSGTANNGTWEAQANTKVNADGTLDINDSTANDWAITGIQLEVGTYTSSDLPPFRHESFAENIFRCQRYYQEVTNFSGVANSTTQLFGVGIKPVRMRVEAPTISNNGVALQFTDGYSADPFQTTAGGISSLVRDFDKDMFLITNFTGLTQGEFMVGTRDNEPYACITLDAEL